jgi:hypothetical protein
VLVRQIGLHQVQVATSQIRNDNLTSPQFTSNINNAAIRDVRGTLKRKLSGLEAGGHEHSK